MITPRLAQENTSIAHNMSQQDSTRNIPPRRPPSSVASPAGGTPPGPQSGPDKCTVIFKEKELTIARYETSADGASGFIITNGTNVMHFDSNGNLILAAGKSGESGCGGKLVMAAEEAMQKYNTYAMEIKGNDASATEGEGDDGNTTVTKVPPFSIVVYGDIALEAVGGDIGMKGKNISIKADNNLSLQATENVTIQSGKEGSGNTTIQTGNFNLNCEYFRRNVSAGEFVEGSGEFVVEQRQPGASINISTPGSVNYTVNGNYELGVKGDWNCVAEGAIGFSGKKNLFMTTSGNYDLKAGGKGTLEFTGTATTPPIVQKETLKLKTGTAGKPSISIEAGGDVEITPTPGAFKVVATKDIELKSTTEVKITGAKIMLN